MRFHEDLSPYGRRWSYAELHMAKEIGVKDHQKPAKTEGPVCRHPR
ncbi:MAG TPA: hypothetical protein VLG44_03170 [Chlamydiales bacterium]|nr:hypothetical protein [Chlamydiales bacterium]